MCVHTCVCACVRGMFIHIRYTTIKHITLTHLCKIYFLSVTLDMSFVLPNILVFFSNFCHLEMTFSPYNMGNDNFFGYYCTPYKSVFFMFYGRIHHIDSLIGCEKLRECDMTNDTHSSVKLKTSGKHTYITPLNPTFI